MSPALRLVAFVLPVAGLVGLWGLSDYQSRQGTDWEVPIEGYDPRDLLRGHYVEFTYDWPEVLEEGEAELELWERDPIERLCLSGNAPVIDSAVRIENDAEAAQCTNLAVANPYAVYGYEGLRRGRLYVSQDRAREIGEAMRETDQIGIVRVRVRDDGTVTPVDIRFRPLTSEEMADRDRPAELPDTERLEQ